MNMDIFRLERFFARYEFQVSHLLCASDCESVSIRDLLALEPEAKEKYLDQRLGYTESPGDPGLRQEISGLYQRVSPDEVLVHTGAEEAIYNFCQSMLGPGDEVVVHRPCYQSLFEVGRALGCRIISWQADETSGWRLDLDFLKDRISNKTKAVIVNLPHNPTGYLMDRGEYEELAGLADRHGFYLFSDEVYKGLEFDPADALPSACDLTDRALSLGVMSKTYGLAGLRIGWVATRNREVLDRMASFKDYTTICNPAPSELLAALALRHRKGIVSRNLEIIRRNMALLDRFFQDYGQVVAWQRPRAGSVAFPSLRQGEAGEYCRNLVERSGVLLAPGEMFGPGREKNFRIGFGRANLEECLNRWEEHLT